jgi:prophage maintenance system killer protein
LNATDEDMYATFLQMAAGEIDEKEFVDWVTKNSECL